MSNRPNVVLIQVDQWRGDCLSIDGHPVVQTPWLDQLATEGVRFSRAYASCPTCIASRASLHTGLSPRSHGRVGYKDGVPWNYRTTLAGEFTKQGYQTQAIGKMHVYPERNRLGFENVILHDGFLHFGRDRTKGDSGRVDDYLPWLREQTGRRNADYFEHGVDCNSFVARPWPMEEYLHPTNWVAREAVDFLRRRDPTKPFFLYISYHRPHPPYDPPAWAFDQYLHTQMPPPPEGAWRERFAPYDSVRPDSHYASRMDPRLLQRARAGYYGHMTHIDHQINYCLEMLREYGLRDNTWVCFTSDHGEMMGDHHLFRKAFPYEGSARTPLIICPPQGIDFPRGAVRDQVVEQRDITPTLLDCAGLSVPAEIEGRSLLDVARGKACHVRPYLHGEHTFYDYSIQWLTDGHHKYVWFSGDGYEQLFDLKNDPCELNNLADQGGAQTDLEHWRQLLAKELEFREEGFVKDNRLVTGRAVTPILKEPFRSLIEL